jgi:hypothetical protein
MRCGCTAATSPLGEQIGTKCPSRVAGHRARSSACVAIRGRDSGWLAGTARTCCEDAAVSWAHDTPVRQLRVSVMAEREQGPEVLLQGCHARSCSARHWRSGARIVRAGSPLGLQRAGPVALPWRVIVQECVAGKSRCRPAAGVALLDQRQPFRGAFMALQADAAQRFCERCRRATCSAPSAAQQCSAVCRSISWTGHTRLGQRDSPSATCALRCTRRPQAAGTVLRQALF